MRVALADDAVILREGLARLLQETGFEVVGMAGKPALELGRERAADGEVAARHEVDDLGCGPEHLAVLLDVAGARRKSAVPHPVVLLPEVGEQVGPQAFEAGQQLFVGAVERRDDEVVELGVRRIHRCVTQQLGRFRRIQGIHHRVDRLPEFMLDCING